MPFCSLFASSAVGLVLASSPSHVMSIHPDLHSRSAPVQIGSSAFQGSPSHSFGLRGDQGFAIRSGHAVGHAYSASRVLEQGSTPSLDVDAFIAEYANSHERGFAHSQWLAEDSLEIASALPSTDSLSLAWLTTGKEWSTQLAPRSVMDVLESVRIADLPTSALSGRPQSGGNAPQVPVAQVPEPSSLTMFGTALALLGLTLQRKRLRKR